MGLSHTLFYDSKDKYNHILSAEVIMCGIDCKSLLNNITLPTQENTEIQSDLVSQEKMVVAQRGQ